MKYTRTELEGVVKRHDNGEISFEEMNRYTGELVNYYQDITFRQFWERDDALFIIAHLTSMLEDRIVPSEYIKAMVPVLQVALALGYLEGNRDA